MNYYEVSAMENINLDEAINGLIEQAAVQYKANLTINPIPEAAPQIVIGAHPRQQTGFFEGFCAI